MPSNRGLGRRAAILVPRVALRAIRGPSRSHSKAIGQRRVDHRSRRRRMLHLASAKLLSFVLCLEHLRSAPILDVSTRPISLDAGVGVIQSTISREVRCHMRRIFDSPMNLPDVLGFDRSMHSPEAARPIWSPVFDFGQPIYTGLMFQMLALVPLLTLQEATHLPWRDVR